MKVKELKEVLEGFDDDLQVRLIADHGQELMTCNGYYEGYITEDSYIPEVIEEEELEGSEIRVCVLEAF